MTTIRAIIVDDEPLSRRVLRQLAMHHADLRIVRECRDGIEALEALRDVAADVVFLDIRMPGVSGLDVASGCRPGTDPQVVFVTAFDRFAVPAFDVAATDYLLKPVTQDRFDRALVRVRERMRGRKPASSSVASSVAEGPNRVVIPMDGNDLVLRADEIEYVSAENVYVVLHTERHTYRFRTTLAQLGDRLDPAEFFRVHRSFIVRLDRIRAIRRGAEGTHVVLASGQQIPIGRRRRQTLQRALDACTTSLAGRTDRSPRATDRSQQID